MTESQIQKKITAHYEKLGWMAVKIMKCSKNGWPDLQIHKNGTTKFIEVKKPGGIISELQKYRIKQLREQGFEAVVMDSIDNVIY